MKRIWTALLCLVLVPVLCGGICGCWLVAAGAGAEGGYVVAQEDRTAKETVNDQFITTAVKTKLLADPLVSGLDINVDTFKGRVSLKGVVSSYKEVDRAIEDAYSVSGVKSVTSKLHVD